MSKEDKNNLFYVCSLIEYIARIIINRISEIVKILGKSELKRQLELAEVNHSLSLEQVSDEMSNYNSSLYYSSRAYLKLC